MTLLVLGLLSIAFTVAFTGYTYFVREARPFGQSRRQALVESWTNVVIGFSINYVANIFILPLVGARLTPANNFWIGCIYTAVSVLRSFVIRRWFNAKLVAFYARFA